MLQVIGSQIQNSLHNRDGEKYHHAKPHAYMEINVADRFFNNVQPGNVEPTKIENIKSCNNCVEK